MIGEEPKCFYCKHFNVLASVLACDAFPKGIPTEIIMGKPHTKPVQGQVGDIVYEKGLYLKWK